MVCFLLHPMNFISSSLNTPIDLNAPHTIPFGERSRAESLHEKCHRVVTHRDENLALKLLEERPNVTKSPMGMVLLALARQQGWSALDAELERLGVDVGARCPNGAPPLSFVMACNWPELVPPLLALGVNPNLAGNNGHAPLIYALRGGWVDVVDALLSAGANPDARDDNGKTALEIALRVGGPQIAEMLMERGVKDLVFGDTSALHLASRRGYTKIAEQLVGLNVDVNHRDSCQQTPLHHAATDDRHEVARLLLRQPGILIDAQDKEGATPLHIAASWGHERVVVCLLEHGADRWAKDDQGRTPGSVANSRIDHLLTSHIETDGSSGKPFFDDWDALPEEGQMVFSDLDKPWRELIDEPLRRDDLPVQQEALSFGLFPNTLEKALMKRPKLVQSLPFLMPNTPHKKHQGP